MTQNPHHVVLLRHTLPDDSTHLDLFIEDRKDPEIGLLSVRMPGDPRKLLADQILQGQMIGRHRRHYLDFEGPLEPGANGEPRGTVHRVATGQLLGMQEEPAKQLQMELQWLTPVCLTQTISMTMYPKGRVQITARCR